jgi:hypothetical protein
MSQEHRKKELEELNCICYWTGIHIFFGILKVAISILNGVLGHLALLGIMMVPSFNILNVVIGYAIGGAILAIAFGWLLFGVSICIGDCITVNSHPPLPFFDTLHISLQFLWIFPINIICAIFEGLVGFAILKLIPFTEEANKQSDYVAAISTVGAIITVLIVFVPAYLGRICYLTKVVYCTKEQESDIV